MSNDHDDLEMKDAGDGAEDGGVGNQIIYSLIDSKASIILADIMVSNGDRDPRQKVKENVNWNMWQYTAKAAYIFARHDWRWKANDIYKRGIRCRTIYIITSDPCARIVDDGGAPLKYLVGTCVHHWTLMGLLEQDRADTKSRWMRPMNPRCVFDMQKRVANLTKKGRKEHLSLNRFPVAASDDPGTMGYPAGTVMITPHTLRVVQQGQPE
jgi:hypothetical protein